MVVHTVGNLMPFFMGLLFLLWTSISSSALAQSLCTEPVAPTCIDIGTTYEAEEELKRCRQDVTDYEDDMKAFEQCLATEVQNAAKLRDQLLERFRCKARKGTDCPPPPEAGSSM